MKVHTTKFFTITILSLLTFVMTSSVCIAQEWSRSRKTELFGTFQTMGGGESSGLGITAGFDDATVYGFGVGYNLDDHLNLNTDFLFGSTDYIATGYGVTIEGDADLYLWNVNLDYNILEDRLTPVVTGGIGLFGLSGADFEESNFSYNLGFGGRWDISDNFAVKALYKFTWTNLEDSDSKTRFDGVMVSLVYMF